MFKQLASYTIHASSNVQMMTNDMILKCDKMYIKKYTHQVEVPPSYWDWNMLYSGDFQVDQG